MHPSNQIRAFAVSVVVLIALLPIQAQAQKRDAEGGGQMARPVLQVQQGQYFRWSAPAGWKHSESTNGVTLTAPDGRTKVMYAILLGSRGYMDPRNFLLSMMSRVPGIGGMRVAATRNLPNQPSGVPGSVWKVVEIDLSCTDNGRPVNGTFTSGINAYYGTYDAMILGYQAPPEEWPRAKLFLPVMAKAITITNFRQVAGRDTLIPVKNNPLDNSGLIESWKQKGLSEQRISQAQREGTMGYERMKDPTTGKIHEMPLEAYDATKGGYHSPDFPRDENRLLVKPAPDE